MLFTTNTHLIDFLWLRGMPPTIEVSNAAFYRMNKELFSLLESYYICFVCLPNK